ncbi:MAG TPA: DUF4392 domain-containing protein [Terriglobales bacterium]|nr:DUF4392 domain-containing protein [Terriglobales bacterium]
MYDKYGYIYETVCHDPGGRGILCNLPPPDLVSVAAALLAAQNVVIATGFPTAGVGIGETDGPPGAARIAAMLTRLGKRPLVVTDGLSADLVAGALAACAPGTPVLGLPLPGGRQAAPGLAADLVISIERPGRGPDGHYRNMRGEVIDYMTADTDWLLDLAPSIAIGDGGNELGMAVVNPRLSARVATHMLAAGISNWWAWGLCALMQAETGLALLPEDFEERQVLAACVAAGGVDGVTRRKEQTVDGLPFEESLKVLRRLRERTPAPR